MGMKNNTTRQIIIAVALIAFAVMWRLINHSFGLAPNLEIITSVTVLAALCIGLRTAIIVPLFSMIISDLFITNSSIYIYTWSSFALIGLGAILLRKLEGRPKSQILASAGFAVCSSFFFFIVTNLGVWLEGWYPMNINGLATCFTLAIPFYRTMLIGNIILVPTVVAIRQIVLLKFTAKKLSKTTLTQ